MACGSAVVSTACPSGPDEIIDDNENGILVPLDDNKALASAIIRLLRNPALIQRFSENAKIKTQDFSISNIINQYEELI